MNFKRFICLILTLCSLHPFISQAQKVIINKEITLPKDSATRTLLLNSLNEFLNQREDPNKFNDYVLPEDRPQTAALLDELKGLETDSELKDKNFYKTYLINITPTQNDNYKIQLAYSGIAGDRVVLRAIVNLISTNRAGRYYFASPLKQNTKNWLKRQYGNVTFFYQDSLNTGLAKTYARTLKFYDKKLNVPPCSTSFYYCDNFNTVLLITGIDYKSDYNSMVSNRLSAHEGAQDIIITGQTNLKSNFDLHDLFHERIRRVISPDLINRPVDEGCAYLYGGSWGLSWPEVFAKFKEYAALNPNADWLSLYMAGTNFVPGPKILKVSYAINALIVQHLEKDKGFDTVKQLLSCGKKEPGENNYFAVLQRLTGINKTDFNVAVNKLIITNKL